MAFCVAGPGEHVLPQCTSPGDDCLTIAMPTAPVGPCLPRFNFLSLRSPQVRRMRAGVRPEEYSRAPRCGWYGLAGVDVDLMRVPP